MASLPFGEDSIDNKTATADGRVAKYLELYIYDLKCPTSEKDVKALVAEYDLKHGDVVSFNDYRDTDSHIVFSQDGGRVTLIPNPDDRGAGYLTIPKEVLANVRDAVNLYKDFIHDEQPAFNLHLSPQDTFVVDRIGHVPSDWEFNVTWDWGSLNSFGIKVPGYEWDELNPSTVSRQAIEERYLSGSPLVSIYVRVELRGEEYHRYVAKYGNTYTQSPSIPSSWLMEGHGGSSGGSDHQSWGWKFTGPQSRKDEVVKNITDFLEGFTYHLN